MKKAKKLLICLTAAALVCSACAVSACGSNDSDIVTDEEWEAAFATENFYNVTIEYEYNLITSHSDDMRDINVTSAINSTRKVDFVDGGNIFIGNFYETGITEETNSVKYSDSAIEDTDDSFVNESITYNMYGSDFYNYATKSISESDGAWNSYSSAYPTGVSLFGIIGIADGCSVFSNIDYVNTLSREYVDGAYVVTIPYSIYDIYEREATEFYYESVGYEFTGGDKIAYIKFNDGKLTSIKLTQTYSLVLGDGTEEEYSETKEYTFTDYGKTSVTIPDEVTALFN